MDWRTFIKISKINDYRWNTIQGSDPPKNKKIMKWWLKTVDTLTANIISSEGKDRYSVNGEIDNACVNNRISRTTN